MSLDFSQREFSLGAMASNEPEMSREVEKFCTVTGADADVGQRMLEACGSNLQAAIGMFMDHGDIGAVPDNDPSAPAGASARAAAAYQEASPETEDGVRAPIPQRNEILVQESNAPIYPDFGRRRTRQTVAIHDMFRDFQAETRYQMALREGRPVDMKTRSLEDLFRPPIDLIFKGSFENAKIAGQKQGRWMLVNVQNVQEFTCQVLNRDVWSNSEVRRLVKENFVLWQVYHSSEEGRKYSQFYRIDNWPYVAVLDPRTGENLQTWHELTPNGFAEELSTFLETHYYNEAEGRPNPRTTRERTIMDASEEDQIEAAIQASLKEAQNQTAPTTSSSPESDLSSLSGEEEVATFTGSSDEEDCSPPPTKKRKSVSPKKPPCTVVTDNGECSTSNNCVLRASPSAGCSSTVTKPAELPSSADGVVLAEQAAELWKKHLGDCADPTYEVLLRFPDNEKSKLSLPSSSQLRALVLYVISKGFSSKDYELVTHFPRRHLSDMDHTSTLSQLNLNPRETVFVQSR